MRANGKPKSAIDDKRALQNLLDLLSIEGLSGREGKVAAEIKRRAKAAGCKPSWMRFDDANKKIPGGYEIGNLIIQLPGTTAGPRRLLMGHMDTVPLCRGAEPVVRGSRVVSKGNTGLGGDNRTAIAALVTTLETILRNNLPHPPLTFLFTVGEEVGLWGARFVNLADLGRPKMGFNIDGGAPAEFAIGALGADRWQVDVIGRSAHAGVHPDHGISAALIASMAIQDAAARGWFGKIKQGKKRGTANIGAIQGGEATNQVTDHVFIRGESRSHDPEFVTEITTAWRKSFERAAKKVKNHKRAHGKIKFKAALDYKPFRIDRQEPVVRQAVAAAKGLGLKTKLFAADGGLDANYLNAKGLPTVTMGAGQHSPHTTDEFVTVQEYLDGCRLALAVATS